MENWYVDLESIMTGIVGRTHSSLMDFLKEITDKISQEDFKKIIKNLVKQIPELADKERIRIKYDYNYDKFDRMNRFIIVSASKNPPIKIEYGGWRSSLIIAILEYVETRSFIGEIRREMERIPEFEKSEFQVKRIRDDDWFGEDLLSYFLEVEISDNEKSNFETLFFNDKSGKMIRVRVKEGKLNNEVLKEILIKKIVKHLQKRERFRKFEKWLKRGLVYNK